MSARTSSRSVVFEFTFALSGLERLPPGTYTVETEEERLDMSFPAFRRTATFIFLPYRSHGAMQTQMVKIDPVELEAALAKDTDQHAAAKVGRIPGEVMPP